MAKGKLWAFRYDKTGDYQYGLVRGGKPRKNRDSGTWPFPSGETWDKPHRHWRLNERDFLGLFPDYELPVNGGPVEIRFEETG